MFNLSLIKQLFREHKALYKSIRLIKKMPRLPVTIFGSARIASGHAYTKQAHELAHMFLEQDIPTLTGGGSGVMEAVQCGASHKEVTVLSKATLGIKVPGVGTCYCCGADRITMDSLYTRKRLLIDYSAGFVIFPGGFGTLNEFTEVVTLIHLGLIKKVPMFLVGSEYWSGLIKWLKTDPLKDQIIKLEDFELFEITDDLAIIVETFKTI